MHKLPENEVSEICYTFNKSPYGDTPEKAVARTNDYIKSQMPRWEKEYFNPMPATPKPMSASTNVNANANTATSWGNFGTPNKNNMFTTSSGKSLKQNSWESLGGTKADSFDSFTPMKMPKPAPEPKAPQMPVNTYTAQPVSYDKPQLMGFPGMALPWAVKQMENVWNDVNRYSDMWNNVNRYSDGSPMFENLNPVFQTIAKAANVVDTHYQDKQRRNSSPDTFSQWDQYIATLANHINEYAKMKNHGYVNLDDYHHCKVNYNGAKLGQYGDNMADQLGIMKEWWDKLKNRHVKKLPERRVQDDFIHDLQIDATGRARANFGNYGSAEDACADFRKKNRKFNTEELRKYW